MKSRILRELWAFRQTLVVVLTPIVLMPLPIYFQCAEFRTLYGLLVMGVYWVTETLPLPVTALLPMVIFPILGVAKAGDLSREYLKDTNMLFVGGFMIAVAVERWNLHKRIALRVLLIAGSQPKWLMLGFMAPSAFLSMWISNTATTAMMVPIARAVTDQLAETRQRAGPDEEDVTDTQETELPSADENEGREKITPETGEKRKKFSELEVCKPNKFREYGATSYDLSAADEARRRHEELDGIRKGITLCVAYAATCGGVATLTGTGTNLVFKGQADSLFEGNSGINFTSWFVFAFPCSVLTFLVAYIWLQIHFLGIRNSIFVRKEKTKASVKDAVATHAFLLKQMEELGPISFAEVMVLVHFVALALLWLTRESDFFTGWGIQLTGGFASDSTPALLLAISLFIVPSAPPRIFCWRNPDGTAALGPRPALLDWQTVTEKFAWGIVLLLGGGYALAAAVKSSGLSRMLADELTVFEDIPPWAICLIITTFIAAITEVTSNVAIATIFLPILAQLSVGIGVNPLYLMIPGCMATSFAYMLPVATPPNAIVFSYGHVRVVDMARAGILLNILCIVIVNVAINTWGRAYFSLDTFPYWANVTQNQVPQNASACFSFTTS